MTRIAATLAAGAFVAFLVVPLIGLAVHVSPSTFLAAIVQPTSLAALRLSFTTSFIALGLAIVFGTPLAFVLARFAFPARALIDALVDVPIVVPPAVAGLALLLTLGRNGTLGGALGAFGIHLSFSTAAVVIAQLFVGAPFYVRAARAGFASVDRTYEEASATLGMSPLQTFARITVPLAAPALLGGITLCWARALGEFGATIMFAGNLTGVSQTLPLAVYLDLETNDIAAATALSLVLIACSLFVVFSLRVIEGNHASR